MLTLWLNNIKTGSLGFCCFSNFHCFYSSYGFSLFVNIKRMCPPSTKNWLFPWFPIVGASLWINIFLKHYASYSTGLGGPTINLPLWRQRGEFMWVWGKANVQSEFQKSHSQYPEKTCVKKPKEKFGNPNASIQHMWWNKIDLTGRKQIRMHRPGFRVAYKQLQILLRMQRE